VHGERWDLVICWRSPLIGLCFLPPTWHSCSWFCTNRCLLLQMCDVFIYQKKYIQAQGQGLFTGMQWKMVDLWERLDNKEKQKQYTKKKNRCKPFHANLGRANVYPQLNCSSTAVSSHWPYLPLQLWCGGAGKFLVDLEGERGCWYQIWSSHCNQLPTCSSIAASSD